MLDDLIENGEANFPVSEMDTPIFWSLFWEYQFSGRVFPVKMHFVKPRAGFRPGVINYIGGYTRGIEPVYTGSYYKRSVRFDEDDPLAKFLKEIEYEF